MTSKSDIEAFVRRAEEQVEKRARGARKGTDEFLDAEYWLNDCASSSLFYLTYEQNLGLALSILLSRPEGREPALLRFLLNTDLEKHFPPIDIQAADYGPLAATINYAISRALTDLLSGRAMPPEWQARTDDTFAAFRQLQGAAKMPHREMWEARHTLLDLAFGRYEKIVRVFAHEHRFPLAKFESADRTLIKACYLLSQVALGTADEDATFGARSQIVLLKLSYYLWQVNDHLPAQIELIPVVLVSWLHERITKGTAPSVRDLFASMAPRAVLTEMDAMGRKP